MKGFSPVLCLFLVLLAADLAVADPAIIKGPYLQNVGNDSITVIWETNESISGRVDYGLSGSYGSSAVNTTNATLHKITLSGLTEETIYHYKTTSGTASSTDNTFQTAVKPATPFRFIVYGDTRTYPSDHSAVVNGIISSKPEIVVHTGDIVSDGRVYSQWKTQFFNPAANLIKNTTMFLALGNHENNASWYYYFFSNPGESGSGAWYSFDYGNSHFIFLDTNQDFSPGSLQYSWLESDLNSTQARSAEWAFIVFHHPPYTSGAHGVPEQTGMNVRTYLVPLFESYGVDAVFSGHDHSYERSFKDGVCYVVSGGGGAPLYDVNQTSNPYQQFALKTYHYCTVDVNGSSLNFNARYINGTVFDSFSKTKDSGTVNIALESGWNLVSIPSAV